MMKKHSNYIDYITMSETVIIILIKLTYFIVSVANNCPKLIYPVPR